MNWSEACRWRFRVADLGLSWALLGAGVVITLGLQEPSISGSLLAACAAMAIGAAMVQGGAERRVQVSIDRDSEGKPRRFAITVGRETVTVTPGATWTQTDHYKWVTRGLLEAPQSFRVSPDGAVEINGEKVHLTDVDACERFEHELNKKFTAAVARSKAAPAPKQATAAAGSGSDRINFRVKLDHLGHMIVECYRLGERAETGLRGLPGLVENGLMLPPQSVHVHPLQEWVEVDGVRYECSEAGARALESLLNSRYAPKITAHQAAIEIRDNPAAATGFDIRFVTVRAGAKFEIKGHLCQEYLDLLQDQSRCDLLQPGIVIKLTPPNLIIRRKRPDGGEEHIPELPDVQYRRITARQLEAILNHPLVRRGSATVTATAETAERPAEFSAIRIWRSPQTRPLLCLECTPAHGGEPVGRALTHHNVTDLQAAGVFKANVEVSLSLDNLTLTILNTETKQEEHFTVADKSSEEDLARASSALTAVLKPPGPPPASTKQDLQTEPLAGTQTASTTERVPVVTVSDAMETATPGESDLSPAIPAPKESRAASAPASVALPATRPPSSPAPKPAALDTRVVEAPPLEAAQASKKPLAAPAEVKAPPVAFHAGPAAVGAENLPTSVRAPAEKQAGSETTKVSRADDLAQPLLSPDDPWVSRFKNTDPIVANVEIFRRLELRFSIKAEEMFLSLPRVFENRRFEVIRFTDAVIESVLDLRSEDFYGFYLSHIREDRIDLVYACRGRRLEWEPDKCVAQPGLTLEPSVFKGSALLGMAYRKDQHFAFIVTQEYKSWFGPYAKAFDEVCAQFITVTDLISAADQYDLIWPDTPPPPG